MPNEEWSPYAVSIEPDLIVHLAIGEVRGEPWRAVPGRTTMTRRKGVGVAAPGERSQSTSRCLFPGQEARVGAAALKRSMGG
jgi:hypothetical protein